MRHLLLLTLTALPAAVADPPAPPAVEAGKPPEPAKPVEVRAAGRSARLTSPTACRWWAVSELVEVVPFPDGKTCVVMPPGTGRWRVIAYTALGDQASAPTVIDVVVGTDPQPMPPGPPPPGPTPPVPPAPPPADPFAAKVRAAYTADPAGPAEKRGEAVLLAELYRQAADLAGKPEIATGGQLVEQVKKAADALRVTGLVAVRNVVAAELGQVADLTTPLTADARAKVASVYKRAAAAITTPE